MRVWITRSQPGADRQAEALRKLGYEVLTAPVTNIRPTGAPLPGAGFCCVVFLSEQAVLHSSGFEFCADADIFAVGNATARALVEESVTARVPQESSSEGLLALLEERPIEGRAVLIVAGVGGRKTLRDALSARGAEVHEYLCYRREPRDVAPGSLADVDVVLVGSQDGFRQVARLWFHSGGSPEVTVIAASERIARLGQGFGFGNVRVARGAATEDWIAALEDRRGNQ